MTTTKATAARTKFNAMLHSMTLDQAASALILVASPKTEEEMMVRIGLIKSIEDRFPAIAAWVNNFYDGDDDAPCWDVEYSDAILLAKEELGL